MREIMMVIRHGVMKKVWINPKDIYNESDVPFVPPDYPTKEMIAEKEKRLAEKAKAREEQLKKDQHDDWNPKVAIESKPEVKPIAKEESKEKKEDKKRSVGRPKKGARK